MRVCTRGLKATDVDLSLAPLTVLWGPNRLGKSTVADALVYALLGHVPRLGAREDRTAILMRGDRLRVDLTLDDGRTITRQLDLTEDGKYRGAINCSWLGKTKARAEEHNVAVLRLVGAEQQDVVEALDIRELVKLPSNQRVARIQALLESQTDADAIANLVARYTMQRLTGVSDEHMPADHLQLRTLVPDYNTNGEHRGQYATLRDAMATLQSKLAEVGLQGAARWANDEKLAAGRGLRPAVQARERLGRRIAELGAEDPEALARLEARRSELEREIGADAERRAESARRRKLCADAALRHATAKAQYAAAVSARDDYEQHGASDLLAKRGELDRLERDTAVVTLPEPPDDAAAVHLEEQARQLDGDAELVLIRDLDRTAVQRLSVEVERLQCDWQAAQADPWSQVRALAEDIARLSGFQDLSARSDLRGIPQALAQLLALAARYGGRAVTEIAHELDGARATLAAEQVALDWAAEQNAAARALQQQIGTDAEALRLQARQLRTESLRAYDSARSQVQEKAQIGNRQLSALRTAIAALEQRDQRTAEAVRVAQTELAGAEQRLYDLGPAPAVDDSEAAETELVGVRAQIDQLQADANTRREFARLVAEIQGLEASEIVYRALERAVIRVREEEVTHAGGPLLQRMRTVLQAAGFTEEPYIAGGDLGWRTVDGATVSVGALSGSELCVFTAALAAAVIALRGAPLRMLITEAAECDRGMLGRLLRGLAAVADQLTHVLVLSWEEPPAIAGWQVIRLGAERNEQRVSA